MPVSTSVSVFFFSPLASFSSLLLHAISFLSTRTPLSFFQENYHSATAAAASSAEGLCSLSGNELGLDAATIVVAEAAAAASAETAAATGAVVGMSKEEGALQQLRRAGHALQSIFLELSPRLQQAQAVRSAVVAAAADLWLQATELPDCLQVLLRIPSAAFTGVLSTARSAQGRAGALPAGAAGVAKAEEVEDEEGLQEASRASRIAQELYSACVKAHKAEGGGRGDGERKTKPTPLSSAALAACEEALSTLSLQRASNTRSVSTRPQSSTVLFVCFCLFGFCLSVLSCFGVSTLTFPFVYCRLSGCLFSPLLPLLSLSCFPATLFQCFCETERTRRRACGTSTTHFSSRHLSNPHKTSRHWQ